jgi:FkbM family methyltransferase
VDLYRDIERVVPGLRDARYVLDVGAHVGHTALSLAEAFPAATVHSFEPVRSSYDQLVAAVRRVPRVVPHHLAVGSAPGRVEILVQPGSQYNSLVSDLRDPRGPADRTREWVEVTTLDAFCRAERIPAIDLLKTDTEGYDAEVLAGGAGLFAAGAVRSVYTEVTFSPANRHNTPFRAVYDFLTERGLRFLGLYQTKFLQVTRADQSVADAWFVRADLCPPG